MNDDGSIDRFVGEVVQQRYPQVVQERYPLEDKVVSLTIEVGALLIDGDRFAIPNRFVCGAFEQSPEGSFRVLLVAEQEPEHLYAPWSFIVPDRATARSILRAARLEAEQGLMTLRLGSKMTRPVLLTSFLLAALIVLGFSTNGTSGALTFVSLLFFVSAAWASSVWAGRAFVTLGVDGFVHRQYGTSHFVAFSDIRSVAVTGSGMVVEQTDGRRRELTRYVPMDPRLTHREEDCFAEVIAMRIRDAIAAQERTNATANDERRKMPIADWIREFRENPILPPSYRMSPRREHDHNRVLEDMTADVVTRACAAIALRVREGEGVVPRIRVAAAATASPKLRVALEKIADGAADDEIARSIEKLR